MGVYMAADKDVLIPAKPLSTVYDDDVQGKYSWDDDRDCDEVNLSAHTQGEQ